MSQNKKKDDKKLYMMIGVLLILILLIIILSSCTKKEPEEIPEEELTDEQIEALEDERHVENLQDMEERDRMEYYFGMFLDAVEAGEYEEAYGMLYEDFRANYFPTLEEFSEYMENTFSDMTSVKHENIERNGDVYVLWITIADAINGKPGEEKEMNIVIKENDYNDFVLSFSVI